MENSTQVPQKTNIELPYDPAIPLLGLYLDKTFLEKDACTHMFIAALFAIAKTLNRQMNRLRRCSVYIHNGILLSHKKEQNNAICSNMGGTRDSHTK